MNIHEAIEILSDLTNYWASIGVLLSDEEQMVNDAIKTVEEYVRINEGGTVND